MGSRDYPSTLHKCVTKACIYSVQFFETKAEVENRMTRGGVFPKLSVDQRQLFFGLDTFFYIFNHFA
jgi:hypothetical protein